MFLLIAQKGEMMICFMNCDLEYSYPITQFRSNSLLKYLIALLIASLVYRCAV